MKKTIISILIIPYSLVANNGSFKCQAFTLQKSTILSTRSQEQRQRHVIQSSSHLLPSSIHVGLVVFMSNGHNQDEYLVLPHMDESKPESKPQQQNRKRGKNQSKGKKYQHQYREKKNSSVSNEIPKYKKLSEILYSSGRNDSNGSNSSTHQKQTRENGDKKEHSSSTRSINTQNDKSDSQTTTNAKDVVDMKPWCANYASSRAIQKRIHAASTNKNSTPIRRAINVAKALLNTPPEWCNESNVVYTLTLSAKVLASSSSPSSSSPHKVLSEETSDKNTQDEFRTLLLDILDTLNIMIKNQKLNRRQLANVSWAIAKHYSMDPLLLPKRHIERENVAVYSQNKSIVSYYEEWDLKIEQGEQQGEQQQQLQRLQGGDINRDTIETRQKRIMESLDEIAKSLIESISDEIIDNSENDSSLKHNVIKAGELSMICWAYSTIFPRLRPPGWKIPPRSRRSLEDTTEKMETSLLKKKNNNDLVLFQSWKSTDTTTNNQEEEQQLTLYDKLFDIIAKRLIWKESELDNYSMTDQLSWKEMSTIAWAYAHRGIFVSNDFQTLISQLARQAIGRLENLKDEKEKNDGMTPIARDVSEIAWALGVLQTDNFIFSDLLEEYVETISANFINYDRDRPLQKWSTADCVQLAVAMAHGRIDDQILLENIYREVILSLDQELNDFSNMKRCKSFQSWELSALLWVQARLYLTKEISPTFDRFADIVPQVLRSRMKSSVFDPHHKRDKFSAIGLGAQETANLCWSLAVLDKYHSSDSSQLVRDIFKNTAQSYHNGKRIKLEHAHQLWQSFFLLDIPTDEVITDAFVSFLEHSWDEEKARRKASSARHKALSQTLNFMNVAHYNEHDEDIDVAIVLKTDSKWLHTASVVCDGEECRTKVAVEFDGPAHFTKQKSINKADPPRTLGHTVLKYKLLRMQGWTVVRVPYYEFDRIPFWASMERQRYLQRKLKTHANIRFSGVDVSEYKAPSANKVSRFD